MVDRCVISKEVQFDAGHRVPNHKSKCRNPHGHRYRVVAYASGPVHATEGTSDEGMVIDFGDLKEAMITRIHDVLDHQFIVYKNDEPMKNGLRAYVNVLDPEPNEVAGYIIFPYVPTAENIAKWCYEHLVMELEQRTVSGLEITCVDVWETPTSMASFSGPTEIEKVEAANGFA